MGSLSKITTSLVLVLSLSSANAGPFIGAGIGINTNMTSTNNTWDNGGAHAAILSLGYRKQLSNTFYGEVKWTHISQWLVGPPFNDAQEDSVDFIGVEIRYEP